MRDNRPIADFIDGKYTFLNELLAKHYGIEGVTGPEFRRVELTTESAQRRLHPGQRADRIELPDPDLRGAARQVSAGERARTPPSASAARMSRVLNEATVGVAPVAAPADGAAPRRRGLRRPAMPDGRAGLRPGELRRHRPVAHPGRQVPDRRQRPVSQRQNLRRTRRNEGALLKDNMPRIRRVPCGKNADLCAGPGRRTVRPAHRAETSSGKPPPTITGSSR